jgi:malate synthase
MATIKDKAGDEAYEKGRWQDAQGLFTEMALADDFEDFLTIPAYERMP